MGISESLLKEASFRSNKMCVSNQWIDIEINREGDEWFVDTQYGPLGPYTLHDAFSEALLRLAQYATDAYETDARQGPDEDRQP